jgi:predicted RNA polymerase sigma factor
LTNDARFEGLLRALAPQALGTLVRRHGQFDACEDAVQEALLAAALQWPEDGVPESPLDTLEGEERMSHTHRLEAVRGHLLELAGDPAAARESYRRAARMTTSVAEQRYLALQAARLA